MSTDSFAPAEDDAKNDVSAIVADARAAAKAEASTAAATATKLLTIAAGHTSQLLTDAESAAVGTVMAKVPEPFRAEVMAFGTGVLKSALSNANTSASTAVQKGLAYAEALIAHKAAAFDRTISASATASA